MQSEGCRCKGIFSGEGELVSGCHQPTITSFIFPDFAHCIADEYCTEDIYGYGHCLQECVQFPFFQRAPCGCTHNGVDMICKEELCFNSTDLCKPPPQDCEHMQIANEGSECLSVKSTRCASMASTATFLPTTVLTSLPPSPARPTRRLPTRSATARTVSRASLATCARKGLASRDRTRVQQGLTSTRERRIVGVRLHLTSALLDKCATNSVRIHLRTVHSLLWLQWMVLVFAAGQRRKH